MLNGKRTQTEALVRDKLRALGYNQPENGITVEEQKSEIAKVKTLLSKASKMRRVTPATLSSSSSRIWDTAFLIVFELQAGCEETRKPGSR